MGGVPAQLVPDNPKVGVRRANWYEPGLNRTYLDLATHYRTAILPTRARKPRDKAKVEVAVLVVERWILARLRPWPTPSSTGSSTMLTDCNSLVTVCASKTGPKPSPLDPMQPVMERSHPTSGRSATPADINRNGRPTSIGTSGRHQSECPADIIGMRIEIWLREQRAKLSRGNDLAKAMGYLLKRWPAFTRFLEDGRVCLSNNAAERAMRGVALGRRSWLFAGSTE